MARPGPILLVFLVLMPLQAQAQDAHALQQPSGDGLIVVSNASEAQGGLTFGPRAIYLASPGSGGGEFAGVELFFGGWLRLEGPLSLVARARFASYFTVSSPAGELDDTACGGGSWGFSLCGGDVDMLAGAGGELGLRLEERSGRAEVSGTFGGELLLSGTGYLDTFEQTREGGSLGAMLIAYAEVLVRERWSIGFELGGRAEAGIVGPSRLGAHVALRIGWRQ